MEILSQVRAPRPVIHSSGKMVDGRCLVLCQGIAQISRHPIHQWSPTPVRSSLSTRSFSPGSSPTSIQVRLVVRVGFGSKELAIDCNEIFFQDDRLCGLLFALSATMVFTCVVFHNPYTLRFAGYVHMRVLKWIHVLFSVSFLIYLFRSRSYFQMTTQMTSPSSQLITFDVDFRHA